MKFTFKRQPKATGLAATGHPNSNTTIKLDGKKIGTILSPTWRDKSNEWSVMVRVKNPLPLPQGENSTWRNVMLKQKFASEALAREYVTQNLATFFTKYPPAPEED